MTIHRKTDFHSHINRQRGAILVFGLVLLLVITVLGSTGIQNVMLEEKMNANQLNQQLAFHGADTALLECENFIRANSVIALTEAASIVELNDYNLNTGQWWSDDSFWDDKTQTAANLQKSTTNPSGLSSTPACVTEFIHSAGSSQDWETQIAGAGFDATERLYYRITAYANGASEKSSAVIETVYVK